MERNVSEKAPDDFKQDADASTAEAIDALWDQLDDVLPEPPTRRMRGRLRRAIWLERLRHWNSGLSAAGMATALVVGLVLGRTLLAPAGPAASPPDYRLETRLLAGSTLAARLEAVVNLREADRLPPEAASALARVVASGDSSTGLQLAALEALVRHRDQSEVSALLTGLLDRAQANPMVEARLLELSGQAVPPPKSSST